MIARHWCPECGSGSIHHFTKRAASTARCNNCQFYGHVSLFLLEKPERQPVVKAAAPDGPYRIAARITIPGYNWKGTRLG